MDFSALMKNKKSIYSIALLFAIGFLLFIFSPSSSVKKAEKAMDETGQSLEVQEQRLEKMLSAIKGAGDVKVYITMEDMGILELAYDYKSNVKGEDKNTEQKTVIVSGSGSTNPVVVRKIQPKVLGVLVVAQGAGDEQVKMVIEKSVAAVLPVMSHRIAVVQKK